VGIKVSLICVAILILPRGLLDYYYFETYSYADALQPGTLFVKWLINALSCFATCLITYYSTFRISQNNFSTGPIILKWGIFIGLFALLSEAGDVVYSTWWITTNYFGHMAPEFELSAFLENALLRVPHIIPHGALFVLIWFMLTRKKDSSPTRENTELLD
jgi:hypothetical protein